MCLPLLFQGLHGRLQVRESEILKEIVSMSMEEIVPIQQLKVWR